MPDEKDLIIQHLITQRNDAHNMLINKMLEASKLQEQIETMEQALTEAKAKECKCSPTQEFPETGVA